MLSLGVLTVLLRAAQKALSLTCLSLMGVLTMGQQVQATLTRIPVAVGLVPPS